MRQSHDPSLTFLYSDALSAVALAKEEGVPLTVANCIFGKDALKPIMEELNEVLVA